MYKTLEMQKWNIDYVATILNNYSHLTMYTREQLKNLTRKELEREILICDILSLTSATREDLDVLSKQTLEQMRGELYLEARTKFNESCRAEADKLSAQDADMSISKQLGDAYEQINTNL